MVKQRELTEDELCQIAGGWSVSTLAAMGQAQQKQGGGGGDGLTLSYGKIQFEY